MDRFFNLVRAGYYDDVRISRVVAPKWAQFGINGDPRIAKIWRDRPIPDDPRVLANDRGTIAFAYAVPNGRTTQVFINLRDNRETHDKEPFAPFGRVIMGMDVVDAWYSEYGENAGSGIRSGKQGPIFENGNAWLDFYDGAMPKTPDDQVTTQRLLVRLCIEPHTMRIEPDNAVRSGDAILIPAGVWHAIVATEPLRFLCCCAPPYSHEDTYFM